MIEEIASGSATSASATLPEIGKKPPTLESRSSARLPTDDALNIEGADDLEARSLPQTSLKLSLEKDLGRVVATIEDKRTGEIIREVPPEELVELAKSMRILVGQLLDRRA